MNVKTRMLKFIVLSGVVLFSLGQSHAGSNIECDLLSPCCLDAVDLAEATNVAFACGEISKSEGISDGIHFLTTSPDIESGQLCVKLFVDGLDFVGQAPDSPTECPPPDDGGTSGPGTGDGGGGGTGTTDPGTDTTGGG